MKVIWHARYYQLVMDFICKVKGQSTCNEFQMNVVDDILCVRWHRRETNQGLKFNGFSVRNALRHVSFVTWNGNAFFNESNEDIVIHKVCANMFSTFKSRIVIKHFKTSIDVRFIGFVVLRVFLFLSFPLSPSQDTYGMHKNVSLVFKKKKKKTFFISFSKHVNLWWCYFLLHSAIHYYLLNTLQSMK